MTIEIRPASGYADLECWVATRNEVAPDDPESTTMMALIRASELERVNLLALLDGEAVGFAALLHVEDGHFGVHRITVVLPAWRRRGIGSALTRAQIGAAKLASMERLEAWAWTDLQRRLYASVGYEQRPASIDFFGPLQ